MVFIRKIVLAVSVLVSLLPMSSYAQKRIDEVIIDRHIVNENLGYILPLDSKWNLDKKELLVLYRFSDGSYLLNFSYRILQDTISPKLTEVLNKMKKHYIDKSTQTLKSLHLAGSANFISKVRNCKVEYYALKDALATNEVYEINGMFQKINSELLKQNIVHPLSNKYIKVFERDPYLYYGQQVSIPAEKVENIVRFVSGNNKPAISAIFYKSEEAILHKYFPIADLFADNLPQLFFTNYKTKKSISGKYDSNKIRTFLNKNLTIDDEIIQIPRDGILVPSTESEIDILIKGKY